MNVLDLFPWRFVRAERLEDLKRAERLLAVRDVELQMARANLAELREAAHEMRTKLGLEVSHLRDRIARKGGLKQ